MTGLPILRTNGVLNPWSEKKHRREVVNSLDNLFDSMIDDFFKDFSTIKPVDVKNKKYPKFNIFRVKDDLVMEASVPYVNKEDLNVELDNGVITIQGKATVSNDEQDRDYYLRELKLSSFTRSFVLDQNLYEKWTKEDNTEFEKMTAKLDHNMLTITLKDFYKDSSPSNPPPKKIEIE